MDNTTVMSAEIIDLFVNKLAWYTLAGITILWFLFLYFGLGLLFSLAIRLLRKPGFIHRIVAAQPGRWQLTYEIKHSLVSILIFGLSAIPIVFLIRLGWATLLPDTPLNIGYSLIVLLIWNEVHFFLVHRLMHSRFFMQQVHYVHHRSKVPTIWSVFSFHWLEAALLSTVSLTLMPWLALAPSALILFPVVSILLNFAGHCNYRFGSGWGSRFLTFGTRHAGHHSGKNKSYGFASHLPDALLSAFTKKAK